MDDKKLSKLKIALVVVDMQNAYCHEQGSLARQGFDISACRKVIENVRRIIEISRKHGVPVVFLYLAFERNYQDGGSMVHQIWPFFKEKNGLLDGTWDANIVDELKPLPEEVVIRKTRYSGFSGTNLDYRLRYMGVDTLIFCGVTTNICVESTLRDAHHLGYQVILISDGTAEIDEERYRASLKVVQYAFGKVITVEEFTSFLRKECPRGS
jgi:ureidoacrylate peracid hydrolase